jgi:GMP synthase (glutamine-hydrolysing)
MSHGDQVSKLPKDFISLGSSSTCKYAIIENNEKKIYGLQFHPEVQHTTNGMKIIRNFVFNICNAKAN